MTMDDDFHGREGADEVTGDQCIRMECLRMVLETDECGVWSVDRVQQVGIAAATFYSFVTGVQLDKVMMPRQMPPSPPPPSGAKPH